MPDTAAERFFLWDGAAGLVARTAPPATSELLAADSWLVEEGCVRGLERHVARFSRACAEAAGNSVDPVDLERFWRQVIAELPRTGAWFPRAELHPGPGLGLRLRPAPPRRRTIGVLPWHRPDPRAVPGRKGPDLHRLARLKARAVEAGADDVVLSTGEGLLTESTTASLLWWEGDVLCRPEAEGHLLPGVTAALIAEQARHRGIAVRRRRATLRDLDGRETWLVNALHGIRPVTAWVGTVQRPGPARLAAHWQRVLDSLALPLPAPHTPLPLPSAPSPSAPSPSTPSPFAPSPSTPSPDKEPLP